MNLHQWKDERGYRWLDIARMLSSTLHCTMYENRLNRVRAGKEPTQGELRALDEVTDGEVCSFREDGV